MRKIIFFAHTGYAGMDSVDNGLYPDDVTDEELNDDAWHHALDNAEAYGIYPTPDDFEYDEDEDDYGDQYSDNIEGWWEDYDPEKHDGLVCGGGEWVWR